MIFQFELKPQLPRLAWAASVLPREPVRVVHGAWVEVHEHAFVEGAWDGPFGDLRFDEATMLVGSGARITRDDVVFAGHSDLHERLYVVRGDGALHVSPSLALVLAVSGQSLDPREPHYYLQFLDAYRAGIRHPRKRIRLLSGGEAELHDVCNLRVTPDLHIERVEKRWVQAPADYTAYASTLRSTLERVVRNASDPARQRRFRPVCMISRGYDSVAVAALASGTGCREAVTYRESGSRRGPATDDGSEIGRALGFTTTVYQRGSAAPAMREGEEEFYLEPWGVDRDVAPMAKQLEGAMLLSGRSTSGWEAGGGARWGLPGNNGLPHLQRPIGYTPGCALTDFRMRVGFLHFAVPAIGAIHAPALHRLTESPEMRPWSVGGGYDKPIPRRIAEEAGVPRHLFGTIKVGGPTRPAPVDSLASRAATFYRKAIYWAPLRIAIARTIGNRLHPRWRLGSFDLQAGAAKTRERYRRALEGSLAPAPVRAQQIQYGASEKPAGDQAHQDEADVAPTPVRAIAHEGSRVREAKQGE